VIAREASDAARRTNFREDAVLRRVQSTHPLIANATAFQRSVMKFIAFLAVLPAFLCACASTPGAHTTDAKVPIAHGALPAADPFPVPKEGITIAMEGPGGAKLEKVVKDLERVTGVHVVGDRETQNSLASTTTGLTGPLDVPAAEVWTTIEGLLARNGFALTLIKKDDPKLIGIQSMLVSGRERARNDAIYVPEAELQAWTRHPAFLITTMVDVDQADVRVLSNSMRTMFTDAGMQQMIPLGNSNSMLMIGLASWVASQATMMHELNERARREAAANPPSKPAEPPKKQ
jgi:hypothetical protein